MSSEKSPIRWRVDITCPRPPRWPGWEGDDFHLKHLPGGVLTFMLVDDLDVRLTARRVRMSYTYTLSLNPYEMRRRNCNRVQAAIHGAGQGAQALAHALKGAFFQIQGDPPELPGPVRLELRELLEKT